MASAAGLFKRCAPPARELQVQIPLGPFPRPDAIR